MFKIVKQLHDVISPTKNKNGHLTFFFVCGSKNTTQLCKGTFFFNEINMFRVCVKPDPGSYDCNFDKSSHIDRTVL